MSSTTNYPYTTPSNYSFDTDKIEVTGGVAKLKQIIAAHIDNEDFTDDTGFTYDNTKAEFTAGKVQQKDITPADSTSHISYNSDVNIDWGDGVLTGTAVGGASVIGGKLDLKGETNQYVDYNADLNADSQQVGCMRMDVTPNWTGGPTADHYFFGAYHSDNNGTNSMQVYTTGSNDRIYVQIKSDTGSTIIQKNLGVYTGWVSGVTKTLELNWDLTTGSTKFFIDGVQFGATITNTGTRSSSISLLRIGQHVNGSSGNPDFEAENFTCFSAVQNTGNHTPVAITDYRYTESVVELPEWSHTGPGSYISLDSLISTESGAPRYIIQNNQSGTYIYWDGAAWSTSDSSYSQANDKTTFSSNVSSLDVDGDLYQQMKVIFGDSNALSDVDDLTLNHTGFEGYYNDDPTIQTNSSFSASELLTASETVVKAGSDDIKHLIVVNGTEYYWDGAAWSVSNGTYAQSSSMSDINTNAASLLSSRSTLKLKSFLHSDDSTTTPELDIITVTYDAALPDPILNTIVDVNGFIYDPNGDPIVGEVVYVRPYTKGQVADGVFIKYEYVQVGTTDSDGFFSGNVMVLDNLVNHEWKVGKQSYSASLPDQDAVDFSTLVFSLVVDE